MSVLLTSRIKSFVAVAICATLAIGGLFFVVFFVFPDTTPPTGFEDFCTYVWAVASWPLSVVWAMSRRDPPFAIIIPLTIVSGLFWAVVVELLLTAKRHIWPNKGASPNGGPAMFPGNSGASEGPPSVS
jgi:hypothetical protein